MSRARLLPRHSQCADGLLLFSAYGLNGLYVVLITLNVLIVARDVVWLFV
jgi:hypothetical protein